MDVRIWPDSGLWDELVRTIPEATFFHSPLWHEIVVRTYPEYAIATCEFMLESGARAVVPCIKTKTSGILKKKERLRSSVFGVYGGILAEGTLAPDCQEQIYRYFTKQKAKMSVHTNPFLPYRLPRSFECKDNFTHVFTIPAAGEDPSRRLSRGAKSNLNQARKKGVSVRIADCPQDVSAYYTVYRDTLRRWGDETLFEYPEQFFFEIMNRAGDAARIWLAEKDGIIIAGAVIFYWNRIVSYWHGASLQDYFSCYPNNMLHMAIIGDAQSRGFGYYDFGSSGGQEGVVRFKKSFGAEQRPFVSGRLK